MLFFSGIIQSLDIATIDLLEQSIGLRLMIDGGTKWGRCAKACVMNV